MLIVHCFNITSKNNSLELYEKLIRFGAENLYENSMEYNDPLSKKSKTQIIQWYCVIFTVVAF